MKTEPNTPWRDAFDVEVLVDGDEYFPALLNACNNALTHIHLSLYWFESGDIANQFIELLLSARDRGVAVTCLLDEIGSFSLSINDRRLLEDAGVLLGWYNPISFERLHLILQRDHSKLFIIDNNTLFIGGTGIADIFAPSRNQHSTSTSRIHWRENMFKLTGPIVVDALRAIELKWQHKSVMRSNEPSWVKTNQTLFAYSAKQINANERINRIKAKWVESKGHAQRKILQTVIKNIRRSSREIILATAYFAPDPRLRIALKQAVSRGVNVIILLPGYRTDHPLLQRAGQYYYQKLLEAGVTIYEYEPSFMHSKIVICDNTVYFGSSNLDIYTQRWSLEANIEVEDASFKDNVAAVIAHDITHSKKISLDNWNQRHWWFKLTSLLAYKIGCWGDFIARQLLLIQKLKPTPESKD